MIETELRGDEEIESETALTGPFPLQSGIATITAGLHTEALGMSDRLEMQIQSLHFLLAGL